LAEVSIHPDLEHALAAGPGARVFAFTPRTETTLGEVDYRREDVLLFGTEPPGRPGEGLDHPRSTSRVRIPMLPAFRCEIRAPPPGPRPPRGRPAVRHRADRPARGGHGAAAHRLPGPDPDAPGAPLPDPRQRGVDRRLRGVAPARLRRGRGMTRRVPQRIERRN